MNRIQGKDHRIGTFEFDKISLSYFDKKKYISRTMDQLLVTRVNKKNPVILITTFLRVCKNIVMLLAWHIKFSFISNVGINADSLAS